MKSMLKADDFYVIHKREGYGDHKSEYWSLPGLMFMSDILLQAAEKAGLETSKTTIRVGEFSHSYSDHSCMSIAYPSPMTSIIKEIRIKGTHMELYQRGKSRWDAKNLIKLALADPNIIDQLAEVIKKSLPKNSKYEKQETK